jgi:hypothetical protein
MEYQHELFDILDCIPNWQQRFASLRDAALYAKALPEYYDYLTTDEGNRRRLQFETVPDTLAANRAERLMRERMSKRPSRANPDVDDVLDVPQNERAFISHPDASDAEYRYNPEEDDNGDR